MNPEYKSMKPKKLLSILFNHDFYIVRTKGSHVLLKSKTNPSLRVTVPIHNKDLKRGTLLSILKQAGLDKE